MKTKKENNPKLSRRDFLKVGAAASAASAVSVSTAKEKAVVNKLDEKVKDSVIKENGSWLEFKESYKQFDQINVIQTTGPFNHRPEIIPKMMKLVFPNIEDTEPGFTQLDWALTKAASALKFKMETLLGKWDQDEYDFSMLDYKPAGDKTKDIDPAKGGIKNGRQIPPIYKVLESNFVYKKKYEFNSKKEAADAIKRAARLYGADLIGITKRDERFDYEKFYSPAKKVHGWEDIPFEPKSVIVLAFEMDYEAMAAAPTHVADAATGEGYSDMYKTAYQLSVFLKNLGYHAIPSTNDIGLSVPYAIQAGLGEYGRNGLLVTYKYGPRVRLAKVYTDFDFVEYDKPMQFGVLEFCKRCMRCADACPANCITKEEEPTFEPSFDTQGNWFVNPGTKKYYNETLKCFDFWSENGNGCSSCITSCPYNKPDFWHHRLVDKISALLPGPVHTFMKEMDKIFGYGNTYDKEALKKFWDSRGKEYLGH